MGERFGIFNSKSRDLGISLIMYLVPHNIKIVFILTN